MSVYDGWLTYRHPDGNQQSWPVDEVRGVQVRVEPIQGKAYLQVHVLDAWHGLIEWYEIDESSIEQADIDKRHLMRMINEGKDEE